jgi:branched-chain amino acid transport system substrate-binding protein
MRSVGKAVTGWLTAGTVVAVVACGGTAVHGAPHTVTTPDSLGRRTVDVYSSLPLQGALTDQADAIRNGIELALAQAGGRAGMWIVNYRSLNDATAGEVTWDPNATAANARMAAEDPKAVYYVGEFSSLASEVSIQILNQAKVPQVSPASTYVGLTTGLPGSAPGEPAKYYSASGVRTFLRIVPIDSVQAAADLMAMKQAGCKRVALATGGDAYGAGMAALLELEKARYGVTIVSDTAISASATDFRSYATSIKRQGADCFFFAGSASRAAVQMTDEVNLALPKAKLFAPDQMCTSAWTNPRLGGVAASADRLIECTLPPQSLRAYPGGRRFVAQYKAKYGGATPDPYAIYGYEAMKLGLDTIASLGSNGNNKADVLKALFATQRRNSVLGTYGFDRNGDTTLKSYGLYRVNGAGDPVFWKTLTPTSAIS